MEESEDERKDEIKKLNIGPVDGDLELVCKDNTVWVKNTKDSGVYIKQIRLDDFNDYYYELGDNIRIETRIDVKRENGR